jgi:hypothetical protein
VHENKEGKLSYRCILSFALEVEEQSRRLPKSLRELILDLIIVEQLAVQQLPIVPSSSSSISIVK